MRDVFVFLDLDDTILDFQKAETIALTETFRQLGIDPTENLIRRYSVINAECWKKLERREWTRAEVLTGRFEILFSEFDLNISGEVAMRTYGELLKLGHFFIPGAEEMLAELAKNYRLFLVSNGTASVQDSRLKSAGIAPMFEQIYISERIGYEKPDCRFFDHCFSLIPGFSKDRAIILGDSLSSDIQGGINAGIQTCLFDSRGDKHSEAICPNYCIRSLAEFPGLVAKLFN